MEEEREEGETGKDKGSRVKGSSVREDQGTQASDTSGRITPDKGEAALSSPENTSDFGSALIAFSAVYGSSPEGSTPTSPVGNVEDVGMENDTSPNQDEDSLQDAGTNQSCYQSQISSDIKDLLEGNMSHEHITSEENDSGQRGPDQVSNTNHAIQEHMHTLNGNQMTHVKQIKEAACFAKHITEEVTKNVSQHIIQKLYSPVEDSKKQIEDFAKVVLRKLEEHERCLEGQRNHRVCMGFLSRTREECESELLEARITALSEDKANLQSQHDELTRTNCANKEQIIKLKKEKASWQVKYMQLMTKRPREEDSEPESAKRIAEDRPIPAPATSEPQEPNRDFAALCGWQGQQISDDDHQYPPRRSRGPINTASGPSHFSSPH